MRLDRIPSSPERTAPRRARLRRSIREADLDALLVTDLTNIRYLTGFTGSNAALLISADDDASSALCTDSRYELQAHDEVPTLAVHIDPTCDTALAGDASGIRLGFEERAVTVAQQRRLSEAVVAETTLVPTATAVETLREVKDDAEIEALRAASGIADAALAALIEADGFRAGRTEREVALDLDERMRRLGSEDVSFPTILAAGENSAIPHHQPSSRALRRGDLVKIDFGACVAGYHSDMTRTMVLGTPTGWQAELHAIVASAQQAGRDAIAAGVGGDVIDAAAREVIAEAGHGDHFGHGLGHGVGLEVHEAPWFGPRSVGIMACEMTVTVEPGVYLPGAGGVRIEDCGVLTADGYQPFTLSPRDLLVL